MGFRIVLKKKEKEMFVINSLIQHKTSGGVFSQKKSIGVGIGPFENEDDAWSAISLLEDKYRHCEDLMSFVVTEIVKIEGIC